MKKPDGLYRLLMSAVSALAADPTKLQMFVDAGSIAARKGQTLSYEERYTLAIVVQEFAGDVDDLFVPIIAWVAEQQPDLLERGDGQPFTFTAEVLTNDTSDIEIKIELSEMVLVVPNDGGGWSTSRIDQRTIGLDEFPGVCGVPLWSLFMRDQLVAQSTDPAANP